MSFLDNARCFDSRFFVRSMITLACIVFAAKISAGYGLAILSLLTLSALGTGRPEKLFFVVLMCVTMTVTSNALVPKSALSLLIIRGTLMGLAFVLTTRVAGMRSSRYMSPVLLLLPYLGFMAISSLVGWNPIISEMKILLYTLIMMSFYSSGCLLLHDERIGEPQLRAMMLSIACYIIIGSILVIPIPAISIMNREVLLTQPGIKSLFCGITSHSQCLGPLCAILGTIVFGDMLMGVRKVNRLHVLLLLLAPYLIWRTQSRTALGAMCVGLFVVLFVFIKDRTANVRWKQSVISLIFIFGLLGSIVVIASPSSRQAVISFINKRGRSDAKKINTEQVLAARLEIAARSLYNFKQSPMIGNGFQVSEEMAHFKARSFKDLIAAPIEKGFIWAAVLEEGGVIGFGLFLVFVIAFFILGMKRKAYIGVSTFMVLLISNMGEFNFFSLTYSGGIMWASVFLGMALDGFRLREGQRRQAAMMMQQRLFGPPPGIGYPGRPAYR